MPSISSSGKDRPQSTTIILSSYSKAVMFIPICSRPPRGITLRLETDSVCFFFNQFYLHILYSTCRVSPMIHNPDLPLYQIRMTVSFAVFCISDPAANKSVLRINESIRCNSRNYCMVYNLKLTALHRRLKIRPLTDSQIHLLQHAVLFHLPRFHK